VQSAVDISKFRAAFDQRFGTPGDEAPWYRYITAMKMGDTSSTVAITTTLDPESAWISEDPITQDGPAPICHAAADLAVNNEAGDGIDRVVVFAPEGVQLGQCGW
jgi:hypothetical protein